MRRVTTMSPRPAVVSSASAIAVGLDEAGGDAVVVGAGVERGDGGAVGGEQQARAPAATSAAQAV